METIFRQLRLTFGIRLYKHLVIVSCLHRIAFCCYSALDAFKVLARPLKNKSEATGGGLKTECASGCQPHGACWQRKDEPRGVRSTTGGGHRLDASSGVSGAREPVLHCLCSGTHCPIQLGGLCRLGFVNTLRQQSSRAGEIQQSRSSITCLLHDQKRSIYEHALSEAGGIKKMQGEAFWLDLTGGAHDCLVGCQQCMQLMVSCRREPEGHSKVSFILGGIDADLDVAGLPQNRLEHCQSKLYSKTSTG